MSVASPSSSIMSSVGSSEEQEDSNHGSEIIQASSREDVLGFKPQKEVIYNLHLPYSAAIDVEANAILADIKAGYAQAVELRAIGIGAGHWCGQLSKYLKLYGRRFSKTDHVLLVKLTFELMIMPTMELSSVGRLGNLLVSLLKKRDLLSRDDLELPWRSIYDLIERSLFSKYELHGLHLIPYNLETTMKKVTKVCRSYFSLEATQEMLDEWRPLLCPYDTSMIKAFKYFEMFLPTDLPPEHHDKGHELWLAEFMTILDCGGETAPFVSSLKIILSRISNRNIGYIDWSDYTPKLFDSLLISLDLPVGGLVNGTSSHGHFGMMLQVQAVANWIISLLGGGRPTQTYLNQFLKATETYYHPSNTGKWTLPLLDLLTKLTQGMVNRIDRERHQHKTWLHPVPDAYKLSNNDITQFVLGMKPVAFLAMFSKRGLREATTVMQHLASMRPEHIIPTLLETAYPAMETLTEPHRLISCMSCLIAVSRNMTISTPFYSAGRQHVLPLLFLSLPGIDPNDTNKCMTAMQLICTFISLLPVIDCSQAAHTHEELSDEERELVASTAQLEDFVLLFLDKLIALIQAYSHDHNPHGQSNSNRHLSPEESLMQKFVSSTFNAVVQQCSLPVFKQVNKKLFDFVSSSIYDVRVAGTFFGTLLKSLSRAHPRQCLELFVPHFHQAIMAHSNDATKKAENLDGELLWNMKLLAETICCNGQQLLPYLPQLTEILDLILKLESNDGHEIAANILEHTLIVLLGTYLLEYRSLPNGIDEQVPGHLPTDDWGVSGDLKNINAKWHIATEAEKEAASQLLTMYLLPELATIKEVASGAKTLTREQILRCLRVVDSCAKGFSASVPIWDGDEVPLVESDVPLLRHRQITSTDENFITLNGSNPRELVADYVRLLLDKLLDSTEDDTKSLLKLIDIYHHTLLYNGTKKDEFDLRWKSFHLFKRVMQNKLLGKKKHVRSLLLHRIQLQHDLRLSNKDAKVFTERHKAMFLDLYRLSCSLYPEVRKKAQIVLNIGASIFAYSSSVLVEPIIRCLKKEAGIEHHQFKGAIYVLLGDRSKPRLAAAKFWQPLLDLWPVIIQADHSEKPSILALIDRLIDRIHRQFESPALVHETTSACIEAARALWNSESEPRCSWEPISDVDEKNAVVKEKERNRVAVAQYSELVQKIVDIVNVGSLQWKFHEIALELLALLVRHDIEIPNAVVELYTKNLIHDSLVVRKLCINGMMGVVKAQKRRAARREVDLGKACLGTPLLDDGSPNNAWLKLSPEFKIESEQDYNSMIFIDKTHWGFYAWPKILYYHAPAIDQPMLNRSLEELSPAERYIHTRFTDEVFVEKLLACLCLEEQKGNDRFCPKRAAVFKGLFRNFGSTFLPTLRPHLERLVAVSDPADHESSHRVAAEILSGLIRGAKHWLYEERERLWAWVIPILEKILSSLTVENVAFWAKCLEQCSESRDPKRVKPLFDLLMDSPLRGDGGSFSDSARMRVLQSFLTQQEWRVPVYQSQVLGIVRDNLTHAYKNVRDRLGSVMCTIFICDRQIQRGSLRAAPKQEEFLENLSPELDAIVKEVKDRNVTDEEASERSDDDWKGKQRLCKTLMTWMNESFHRMTGSLTPDVYRLLPLLCLTVGDCNDDELKTIVSHVLKLMPRTQVHKDNVPVLLETLGTIAALHSWHARVALLKFFQAHVFYNLFTLGDDAVKTVIKELVLKLLRDVHLEVRELAAVTFGGLLQCGYLDFSQEMLDHFERLSGDKKRRRRATSQPLSSDALIRRHAGILGLSACVLAYPYEVPDFVPAILMVLSDHLDDPQPVQLTVKKALSNFRRTHLDNWNDHKQKFTDDQLVSLTDVLVSPNYYA